MTTIDQSYSITGSTRDELTRMLPIYSIIYDALEGELQVKSKTTKYLPLPNDCGGLASERYKAYLTRAVYYNVTAPTRDALVGQIFLRQPMIEMPDIMKSLDNNINGEGLSMVQLLKKAAMYVIPYGRGGFLAEFPKTNGEVTKSQIESGEVSPTIRFYEPWAIRNWQVKKVGPKVKLVLLVLDETVEETGNDDSYNVDVKMRRRVYKLLPNGNCQCYLYQESKSVETYNLTDGEGKPLQEIPFEFIGSENNDPDIDEAPLYNMANLNIAHFRNSADYEESVFLVGQPTPVYAGLTQDWVENYFPKGVPFGSRATVPLPIGATAQLLQAQANMLAFEAMTHKEEQMISIGGKIINPKRTVERKEAEIDIEAASQRSVLTTSKDNLELAFQKSLMRAAGYIGQSKEKITVKLNDNFDLRTMSAEQLRLLMDLYGANGIAFVEYRENLRRSGLAKLKDDEAIIAIKGDQAMKKELAPEVEKPTKPTVGKAVTKKTPVKKKTN